MAPWLLLFSLIHLHIPNQAGSKVLPIAKDDISISGTASIRPGTYSISDLNKNGVLQITGHGFTVDFKGASLISESGYKAKLDQVEGTGILIKNAKNLTLKNATVRGYRWNIRVEDSEGVKIENCDVGYSRSQRIMRGEQPVNIFLDLRNEEAWATYGAGIWVERCKDIQIEACKGNAAQNGALILNSSKCTVHGSDFSFNSGWGIGFYRSSDNVASWNKCDFVNRPWGGGWGGDSAALVVVNGSHRNFIVGNSLTHSGEGFFLSDHRNGGDFDPKTLGFDGSCNDNVIAYNEGSWSTANAFEGTFSLRNVYFYNFANDSNYGFWLGYSSLNSVLMNWVQRNRFDGIALEQGQGTRVEGNYFEGNAGVAIHLWSSPNPELMRRNPSKGHEIIRNSVKGSRLAVNLDNSFDCLLDLKAGSGIGMSESPIPTGLPLVQRAGKLLGTTEFTKSVQIDRVYDLMHHPGVKDSEHFYYPGVRGPTGWDWIQFEDFAPRDFRHGLAAWRSIDAGAIELFLLDDNAKVTAPDWVELKQEGWKVTLTCKASESDDGEYKTYNIQLKSGSKTQEIKGRFLSASWDCRWYKWPKNDASAYTDDAAWKQVFESAPVSAQILRKLPAIEYGKQPAPNTGTSYFALIAKTKIKFDAGKYRFSSLSDDGFRLFVDGKEIISRWNHHGATPDEVTLDLTTGVHEITVHYCQEFGGCVLLLNWGKV